MTSARLPGKVMRLVSGQPMLGYLLDRLEKIGEEQRIIVATSTHESDEVINSYCGARGTECVRGPLDNVAERVAKVLDQTLATSFVRISADSPLMDPELIKRGQNLFAIKDADLVTNVLHRTYPKGMSVEIVDAKAFRMAYAKITKAADKEHVTRVFYKNPDEWKIEEFQNEHDLHGINLSVDTEADFLGFSKVIARMERPHWTYGLGEILHLMFGTDLAAV